MCKELELYPAEFTEQEAIEYFNQVFDSYDQTLLNVEWSDYVVNGYGDIPEHREVMLTMYFVLGSAHHIYTFDVWMEGPSIYGEW